MSGPAGPGDRSGIWIFSTANGELRKLIGDAMAGAALSPDESSIVFRRMSAAEIWMVKTTGEGARRLLDAPVDGAHDSRLGWFPDGRRIAFSTAGKRGGGFSIESYDLVTGRRAVMLPDQRAGEFCLTRDGRIIYTRLEVPPNEKSSNVWQAEYDLQTGEVRGAAVRLTNWAGFLFSSLGASADGRRIFFLRLHYQNSVSMAELEDGGTRLATVKRFSFEQWTNWPTAWTRDGKELFFNSDRNGRNGVFRQGMAERDAVRVGAGAGEQRDARVSPDGRWLLYLEWPPDGGANEHGRLMRADLDGGNPHALFPVRGYSSPKRIDPLVSVSAEGNPAFRCPTLTGAACVLSEEREGQVVFTEFDAVRGKGREVLAVRAGELTFWDLSADGRRIAFGRNDEDSGRIRLVSLAGEAPRAISAVDFTHLLSAAWAPEGDALFVTAFASKGAPLLRIGLDGKTRLLYRGLKYVENPVVSPDGRRLAFGEMTEDGNAWIMDSAKNP